MENLISLLENIGYQKHGYGYRKITQDTTHWVTLFEGSGFQMYSYAKDDLECEKLYDTGLIFDFTLRDAATLIDIFIQNYP